LRLASASESVGDTETAITLLRAIIEETADAAEDQMARLKLGQLLRTQQPNESRAVLTEFLSKYPQSEWARSVRESLQTYV
jgi:TolA-binding protein